MRPLNCATLWGDFEACSLQILKNMGGKILGYNSCPCSIFLDLRMQIGWRVFRNPKVEDDWTLECPEICAHMLAVMVGMGLQMPFGDWWMIGWAYRCHLDVDCVRDSLARTCVPAKEKMGTWHVAGAGFQMLGIDVSWLVAGVESGASNGDERTRDGYFLSMNGKRVLGDFN